MPKIDTDQDAFIALYAGAEHAVFQLQTHTTYELARNNEVYRQFLAGEDAADGWFHRWLELTEQHTKAGKRIERVRMVDAHPNDYLRFEISEGQRDLAYGGDVRYLVRDEAKSLGLPHYDYWLIDSRLLIFLHFDENSRFVGFEQSVEPREVLRHAQLREGAWHYALTYQQYQKKYGDQ